MASKSQVRSFMRRELQDLEHPDLWQGGEVNCTRLAENAAWHFDCDHWLDDETHWVWDLAFEVAEGFQGDNTQTSGTGLSNCRSPFGPWG